MEILHASCEGSLKKYIMGFYQKVKVELHSFKKLLI